MQTSTTAPLFFLPKGHLAIENYRRTLEPFYDFEFQTLSLNIHKDLVEKQDGTMVQQLLLALQHYPELIPKLLLSFDFTFSETEGSNLYIAKRIWKHDPAYYKWFHALMEIPFMLFFIQDEDARYYALAGDMLAAGEVQVEQPSGCGIPGLTFTREQLQVVHDRLFHACLSFLIFCHGSGFNPVIYVEGLLAFFDADFTYEDVLCEYASDVLKGTFRVAIASEVSE